MNIKGLVEQLVRDEAFMQVINNPLAQFGRREREYLGASVLPEREVPENAYVEEGIRYRSVIANDGTRYSPVQKKAGVLIGAFQVILGNSDIGSEFTSAEYDALLRILSRAGQGGNPPMSAIQSLLDWADATLTRPLIEKNEKQRWEAIVDASVVRTGDNGYKETVSYSAPTGHRPNAAGVWSNNAYDPWADIIAGAEKLAEKGYTVNRVFAGRSVISKLANNTIIKQRGGVISIASGTVVGLPGRMSKEGINSMLAQDGIPPIEEYNLQYQTSTSQGYFLKRDVFVMLATTGRDESLDLGDDAPAIVRNSLGYVGVGRAAGQSGPGRVVTIEQFDNKPPRVEGEAWQTSLPVITEPEAIYVIKNIT